ncbi:MAG: formyltransferase family protein, partial [Tumebacillaceae bacterium]
MNVSQQPWEEPIEFYLLTESSFHPSYLVSKWFAAFENTPGFKGCLIRDDQRVDAVRRNEFHQQHQFKKQLSEAEMNELLNLYGELSKTEEAMIRLSGIPPQCAESFEQTLFLGPDINAPRVYDWLQAQAATGKRMMFFIFLDKLLAPWWIEFSEGRIINSHSAVLPFARGFYAVENMAIRGEIDPFRQAVGATTHYIDNGIDTGPIIRAKQIKDPFACESIWE